MSDTGDRVDDAADRIETALGRVESAVNNKWSTIQWVVIFLIGSYLWSLPGDIWHSKWRYAQAYGIAESDVYIQEKPHDCAFLAAPLGEKYCHHERVVLITRWATSTTGNSIVSYDDGKSWTIFDPPAGKEVPKLSTVEEVIINWEKKDD
jgi:hypothetical protein